MSKKILVAEDGILNARLLKTILEKEGFVVCHVENGEDAYDKIASKEFVPDLLITDIMMPYLNGFELVAKLKAANIMVPVVFISSKTEAEDVAKGLKEFGAKDYIAKPFSPSECIARVKKALAA